MTRSTWRGHEIVQDGECFRYADTGGKEGEVRDIATMLVQDGSQGRDIKKIWFPDNSILFVGPGGIDAIVAYEEAGQCADVPWLAVYKLGRLIKRVNPTHVAIIEYEEPAP